MVEGVFLTELPGIFPYIQATKTGENLIQGKFLYGIHISQHSLVFYHKTGYYPAIESGCRSAINRRFNRSELKKN